MQTKHIRKKNLGKSPPPVNYPPRHLQAMY